MENKNPIVKLFEMISLLHDKGYQKLRVMTYFSPSGCYMRCEISTKDKFDKRTGFILENGNVDDVYRYSTSNGFCFFNSKKDMKNSSIEEIAFKFEKLYPSIIKSAKGEDKEYALWFKELLPLVREDILPYAFEDEGYSAYGAEKLKLTNGEYINFPPSGGTE